MLRFTDDAEFLSIGTNNNTAIAIMAGDDGFDGFYVRPVPPAVSGGGQRIRVWAETLSGMHADAQLNLTPIQPDEWLKGREMLRDNGGAPPEWQVLAADQRKAQTEAVRAKTASHTAAP